MYSQKIVQSSKQRKESEKICKQKSRQCRNW